MHQNLPYSKTTELAIEFKTHIIHPQGIHKIEQMNKFVIGKYKLTIPKLNHTQYHRNSRNSRNTKRYLKISPKLK